MRQGGNGARVVPSRTPGYVSNPRSVTSEAAMARNTSPKNKAGNGTADPAAENPDSLDQVRDILFGGQMRMVETRLRGLEERLMREQTSMRNDLVRTISELETASKKEFATQAERLATERAKRADDLKALGAELKDALKSLERRHQKLEDTAALADAELRDQLLKASAGLTADLARTGERLSAELERTAGALRAEKLDTAAFAGALNEIATRLTGNGRAAHKGSSKG